MSLLIDALQAAENMRVAKESQNERIKNPSDESSLDVEVGDVSQEPESDLNFELYFQGAGNGFSSEHPDTAPGHVSPDTVPGHVSQDTAPGHVSPDTAPGHVSQEPTSALSLERPFLEGDDDSDEQWDVKLGNLSQESTSALNFERSFQDTENGSADKNVSVGQDDVRQDATSDSRFKLAFQEFNSDLAEEHLIARKAASSTAFSPVFVDVEDDDEEEEEKKQKEKKQEEKKQKEEKKPSKVSPSGFVKSRPEGIEQEGLQLKKKVSDTAQREPALTMDPPPEKEASPESEAVVPVEPPPILAATKKPLKGRRHYNPVLVGGGLVLLLGVSAAGYLLNEILGPMEGDFKSVGVPSGRRPQRKEIHEGQPSRIVPVHTVRPPQLRSSQRPVTVMAAKADVQPAPQQVQKVTKPLMTVVEKTSENVPVKVSEDLPGKVPEKVQEPKQASESLPEKMPEKVQERTVEKKAPRRAEGKAPEAISVRVPEKVADKRVGRKSPENAPKKRPKKEPREKAHRAMAEVSESEKRILEKKASKASDAGSGKMDPLYGQGAEIFPESVSARLNDASLAFRKGHLEEAKQIFYTVLHSDPRNHRAMVGLASVAMRRGDAEKARFFYRRVLREDPRNSLALTALLGLNGSANAKGEESRLKHLLYEFPDASHLHFALGNVYAAQRRWAEAYRSYSDANYLSHERNPEILFNLAASLDHMRRFSDALIFYRKAVVLVESFSVAADAGAPQPGAPQPSRVTVNFDVDAVRRRIETLLRKEPQR